MPAVVAGIAVLVAACGGSAPGTSAPLTAYQRELAYAECMRAHGLPTFPDPQSNGTFTSTPQHPVPTGGQQFLSANRACEHLEGPGSTPVQLEQNVTQILRYAACMRAHGIAGFQAKVHGNRVEMGVNGPSSETNTPQFLSAQRACRKLQPGAPGSEGGG
jgi:hypothetical protein